MEKTGGGKRCYSSDGGKATINARESNNQRASAMQILVGFIVLGGWGTVGNVGQADTLPAPWPVPDAVAAPEVSAPPVDHRRSAYDVWQYYAVDRQGYFQPRVIYPPGGHAFYLYNGQPFPWASVNTQEFTPAVQGTPYRRYMPYAHD